MATLKQLGYPVDIVLGADATLVLVSPFCNADDIERTGRNLKSAGHPFIDAEPGAGRSIAVTCAAPSNLTAPAQPAAPRTPEVRRNAAGTTSAEAPAAVEESVGIRITTAVAIDGWLDEEAWTRIEPTDGFRQREPDEGEPASERTELRIGYDEGSLYVGARLFDSDPSGIVQRLSRRDAWANADTLSVFRFISRPPHGRVMFEVSAAGVQRDALIYDDSRTDDTWDAVWYSAVDEDAEGWTVEHGPPRRPGRDSVRKQPGAPPLRQHTGQLHRASARRPLQRRIAIPEQRWTGPEVGFDEQRHHECSRAPGFWPGGSGSVGHQPHRVRDLL